MAHRVNRKEHVSVQQVHFSNAGHLRSGSSEGYLDHSVVQCVRGMDFVPSTYDKPLAFINGYTSALIVG